jgi:prevent-host-death family protein
MTRQVNLYEAKTNLSQLVEDAAKGEEIIIAKNGKPMAKLVVVDAANSEQPEKRALGQWAHLVDPNDKRTDEEWWRDWKALDAEIERDFEEGLNRDLQVEAAEQGREYKWDATSSTPTSSSGRKKDRPDSGRVHSRKSKKRKTRSS